MKSSDGEKAVLQAIESQLRTEDPRIVACFLAFNSVTPQFEPQEDQHLTRPRKHHWANPSRRRFVAGEAMLVSIPVLIALATATIVWLIASISQ
jgi:Protein of unknown function (DUF3040)